MLDKRLQARVVVKMLVPEGDVNAAVVACRFMAKGKQAYGYVVANTGACEMHECIPKKGTKLKLLAHRPSRCCRRRSRRHFYCYCWRLAGMQVCLSATDCGLSPRKLLAVIASQRSTRPRSDYQASCRLKSHSET